MKYDEYVDQRKALIEQATALIDEGKIEDANAKMDEVRALDEKWDQVAQAQANARALAGEARKQDVANPGAVPARNDGSVVDQTREVVQNTKPEELYKTDEYKVAWAKTMMGQTLTASEQALYDRTNEYTHTTKNTGDVIPESVAAGIFHEIEGMYPFYADITKTTVPGILTIIRSKESSEAGWYDEAIAVEDGKETFETIQLSGCELARAITVSYKLREMAMEDFIPYIQRRIAEKMGKALGYGVTNGKGPEEAKPEPMGIVTYLKKEGSTPQVVEYADGKLTYDDLATARGKVLSAYAPGLKLYGNASTIWNVLAKVKDNNGRPVFINDATAGGVNKVLGATVVEDASFADGDLLFSNAARGYQANINRQVGLETETHAKARTIDYVAYAIVDGAPLTSKAHALLTKSDP